MDDRGGFKITIGSTCYEKILETNFGILGGIFHNLSNIKNIILLQNRGVFFEGFKKDKTINR